MRSNVNVAASIVVCLSAARQRSELLANAIIARNVRVKTRTGFTAWQFRGERCSASIREWPHPICDCRFAICDFDLLLREALRAGRPPLQFNKRAFGEGAKRDTRGACAPRKSIPAAPS